MEGDEAGGWKGGGVEVVSPEGPPPLVSGDVLDAGVSGEWVGTLSGNKERSISAVLLLPLFFFLSFSSSSILLLHHLFFFFLSFHSPLSQSG
jgi:hypothetical protein